MKFSITTLSALLLVSAASVAQADSYADAIKSWCGGKYLHKKERKKK